MKTTRTLIIALCAGAFILSCQKAEIPEAINQDTKTTIEAGFATCTVESKTQMTPGADDSTYKVLWQENDKITVNGVNSETTVISADGANATFTFGTNISAPFYAVYSGTSVPTYSEGRYIVTVPATQTYEGNDQFSPEAAIMYGYAAIDGKVRFSHAMSYIRLSLIAGSDNDNIASIKLASNGKEALCGSFEAKCTDGIWTFASASAENASEVTLTCPEGAALGSKMLIAIPAGTYATGLTVTVTDINGHTLTKKAGNSFTGKNGGIYDMAFEFAPASVDAADAISTVEDWKAFAEKVTAGDDFTGKTIILKENLNVDTFFDYANGTFNGTFDGNGKTMTANGNIWPLFNTIGTEGKVINLTMDGEFDGTKLASAGEAGTATIAKVNKGLIKDCTNNANATINIASGVVFGMICAQNGGIVENCYNYGTLDVTYSTSGNAGFYGGGISAIGHSVLGSPTATYIDTDETCTPGTFINCENHGQITATATAGKGIRCGYGGICGVVYLNGVKFEGCKNTGKISRISNGESSSNFSASVGGILGRSAAWYTTGGGDSGALDTSVNGYDTQYINCTNSGTLYCFVRHSGGISATGSGARSDGIGGIVGTAIGNSSNIQKLTGCSNTGDVTGGWNANVNTAALGGIVGIANYTEMSECSAICKIESKSTEFIGAAGGLAACVFSGVSVKENCIAKPEMNIYAYTGKPFFYGLIFGNIKTSASIENTQVAGSITADGTAKDINSDNFMSHITSASSNVSPSTSNITWYTK